jgi:hypothetical protein
MPAGNGGRSGLPLTKCFAGTGILSARPGIVLSFGSREFLFFMKANMASLLER